MTQLIIGLGLIGYASLVLMTSINVWVGIVRSLAAKRPILEARPAPAVRWGLLDLMGGMVGFILLLQVLVPVFVPGEPGSMAELTIDQRIGAMWAQITAQSLVCLVIFALICARGGLTLITGDNWADFRKDVFIGVAAFCALCVPVIIIQVVIAQFVEYKHELINMITESPTPEIIVPVIVSAVLVAPITEEFVFRLLLQGWLEDIFSVRLLTARQILVGRTGRPGQDQAIMPPEETFTIDSPAEIIDAQAIEPHPAEQKNPELMGVAIFVSSAIFALLHFGQGAAPIPLFFLALGLGYVYQKRRTIVPSLVVHMMLNGQSMLLLILQIFFGESLEAPPV